MAQVGDGQGRARSRDTGTIMGWKPPQKAKRDGNEAPIVDAFRKMGLDVEPTDKPLDLILGYEGSTYLVEVKNGAKAPLTDAQKAFFGRWRGHAAVVTSMDEAIEFARAVKAGEV